MKLWGKGTFLNSSMLFNQQPETTLKWDKNI